MHFVFLTVKFFWIIDACHQFRRVLVNASFFERNAICEMSRSFDVYVNRKWGGVSKEIIFLIMICVMGGLGYILRIYRVKKMK